MRTTLTLDDRLAKALKNAAVQSGKSFKQLVNETLHAGLMAQRGPRKPRSYRLRAVSLGGVMAGANLAKALGLAARLEDEEIARKLVLKK